MLSWDTAFNATFSAGSFIYNTCAPIVASYPGTVLVVTTVATAPVAVPVALGVIGFTSTGITAGSVAAGWMSAAAVANGGGVAVGSYVAVMQSVAATGFAASYSSAAAFVAGAATVFASSS